MNPTEQQKSTGRAKDTKADKTSPKQKKHYCKCCGYEISPEVDYCGECICEEDGP